MIFTSPKIYDYNIVIIILTNGSEAIGVKFHIIRILIFFHQKPLKYHPEVIFSV